MKTPSIIKRIFKNKLLPVGIIIIVFVTLVAIFEKQIAPHSYTKTNVDIALKGPSAEYPFGTDLYGRCVYSRVIYGTRIALKVGLLVVSLQTAIGLSLGLLAGFYGKWVDRIILFICDLTWSIPGMILAMAIVTLLGPSLFNVLFAIALVSWGSMTRVVRSKTISIKTLSYVEAARAFGEHDLSIMFRYILPSILPTIIVLISLSMPSAILSAGALAFLGLGSQPPSPDWGLIIFEGNTYIKTAPWISVFPGAAMMITVLGFNFLGEGIRDLLDPRMKR